MRLIVPICLLCLVCTGCVSPAPASVSFGDVTLGQGATLTIRVEDVSSVADKQVEVPVDVSSIPGVP